MATYDELDLHGLNVDNFKWRGDVLRANYGSGYGDIARVGPEAGLHIWQLSDGGFSPDRDSADYLPIDGVSRFEYYYEFFKEHTTGATEIFIIEWRSRMWHVSLSDPDFGAENLTSDLFGGLGVTVRQRRVVGITYNTDGSIDSTLPDAPTGLYVVSTTSTSVTLDWDAEAEDVQFGGVDVEFGGEQVTFQA